jgi:hypothetical protein
MCIHWMSMPWVSFSSSTKSSLLITSFPVLVLHPFFFQPWTQLVMPFMVTCCLYTEPIYWCSESLLVQWLCRLPWKNKSQSHHIEMFNFLHY